MSSSPIVSTVSGRDRRINLVRNQIHTHAALALALRGQLDNFSRVSGMGEHARLEPVSSLGHVESLKFDVLPVSLPNECQESAEVDLRAFEHGCRDIGIRREGRGRIVRMLRNRFGLE
jgi:hypothetical protein